MIIKFKNGSRITCNDKNNNSVRSKPKDFYLELFSELKWYQKLWLRMMLKYQRFKYWIIR